MPLILEMSQSSTIADLGRLIEETTGLSTNGFRFASPVNLGLGSEIKIFEPGAAETLYSMPAIALDDGVGLMLRTLTGKTVCFRIEADDLITHGKTLLFQKEGIPEDQQRWIYAGKQLEDGESQ